MLLSAPLGSLKPPAARLQADPLQDAAAGRVHRSVMVRLAPWVMVGSLLCAMMTSPLPGSMVHVFAVLRSHRGKGVLEKCLG